MSPLECELEYRHWLRRAGGTAAHDLGILAKCLERGQFGALYRQHTAALDALLSRLDPFRPRFELMAMANRVAGVLTPLLDFAPSALCAQWQLAYDTVDSMAADAAKVTDAQLAARVATMVAATDDFNRSSSGAAYAKAEKALECLEADLLDFIGPLDVRHEPTRDYAARLDAELKRLARRRLAAEAGPRTTTPSQPVTATSNPSVARPPMLPTSGRLAIIMR